jgi:hypothetical protein
MQETTQLTPPLNHSVSGAVSGFLREAKNKNLEELRDRTQNLKNLKLHHILSVLVKSPYPEA